MTGPNTQQHGRDSDDAGVAQMFVQKQVVVNAFLVLVWIVFGVIVVMASSGHEFVTSLYMVVQIATTIGYGDVRVPEDLQVFVLVYAYAGLFILAKIVNDYVLGRAQELVNARLRSLNVHMSGGINDEIATKARHGTAKRLVVSQLAFLVFLFGGAMFYSLVEDCSCPYDEAEAHGCSEEDCHNTGGHTKSFQDSLYMSMITMTTIGFGDQSPHTKLGRLVGVFWMIGGVLATVEFISCVGNLLETFLAEKKNAHAPVSRELLCSGTGWNKTISQSEFRILMLLQKGVITEDNLRSIDLAFKTLDTNHAGHVEHDVLQQRFGRPLTEA